VIIILVSESLWTKVLEFRRQNNTWDTIIEGDVVWNHEHGGRTFKVAPEEVGSDEIVVRTSSFELSPSGPLWGSKMRLGSGDVLQLEHALLRSVGVLETHLLNMKRVVRGARRPLRVQVVNQSVVSGTDTEGDFIEVKFELPAGSYATVVIEHLLNDETQKKFGVD